MDILKTDLNGTDYTITVNRDGFSSSNSDDNEKQEYDYKTFEVSYETSLKRNFKSLYLDFKNDGIKYSVSNSYYTICDSLVSLNLISTDDVTFKIYNDGFRKLCNKNNLSTLDTEYELSLSVSDDNYIYSDKIPEMPNTSVDSTNLWITIPTISTWTHSISKYTNGHINITKFINTEFNSTPNNTLSDNILAINYTPTEYYVTITASTYDGSSTSKNVLFNLSYEIQYSSDDGSTWSKFKYSSNTATGTFSSVTTCKLYIPISYNPSYQWRIYISECTLYDTSGDNSLYSTTLNENNNYILWNSSKWYYYAFKSQTSITLNSSQSESALNNITYNFSFVKSAPQMVVYFDNRVRGPYEIYYNIKNEISLGKSVNIKKYAANGEGTMMGRSENTVAGNYRYRYYYLNTETVMTSYTSSSCTLAHKKSSNSSLYTTDVQIHSLSASSSIAYTYITFENTYATDISVTLNCSREPDSKTLKTIKKIGKRYFRYVYYSSSGWQHKYEKFGQNGLDNYSTGISISNLSYKYPIIFGLELQTKQDNDLIANSRYALITIEAKSSTWSDSKKMTCKIYLYPSSIKNKYDENDDD